MVLSTKLIVRNTYVGSVHAELIEQLLVTIYKIETNVLIFTNQHNCIYITFLKESNIEIEADVSRSIENVDTSGNKGHITIIYYNKYILQSEKRYSTESFKITSIQK